MIDWTKIEIKTTDLGNNTYLLEGYNNTTVAVGTDGIIMVDSQFAPLSEKVKAAIKIIAPLPIKYLINTHFHGDHTGGNESRQRRGCYRGARQHPGPPGSRHYGRPDRREDST